MKFFRVIDSFDFYGQKIFRSQLFACAFNEEYLLPVPDGFQFSDFYEEVQL